MKNAANNTFFETEKTGFIDFSERNPFSEGLIGNVWTISLS